MSDRLPIDPLSGPEWEAHFPRVGQMVRAASACLLHAPPRHCSHLGRSSPRIGFVCAAHPGLGLRCLRCSCSHDRSAHHELGPRCYQCDLTELPGLGITVDVCMLDLPRPLPLHDGEIWSHLIFASDIHICRRCCHSAGVDHLLSSGR